MMKQKNVRFYFFGFMVLVNFIAFYDYVYDCALCSVGPLGQGIGNAVGLALAEKHLAATFNKPDVEVVDHYM
ncbi:hypothetical protein AALP_AA3G005100 [Arabis alpina]|uniref:Transketolase N-terminal domain-containing protein n=1 Tax=Arabis alpina TaxID=50452 RepID=A0A087H654_ARAAL|nr:hypothetical protein AALP_AA3G005100 [Arabis alpina]